MQNIDTLLNAKWVIPVDDNDAILHNHSLVINQGNIVDVLPTQQAKNQYQAKENRDLLDHAIIPGFINSHTHAAMNLLRGFADDLPLMDWLENHIWPAEAKWVSPQFVYEGTQLAIAESLRSGVTCFNDMYFFPDEAAKAIDETGFRATVGLIVIDFPTVWASNADDYLAKGQTVYDTLKNHPRIRTALAPHAPYTVSDEPLKKIAALAEKLDIPIHIHLHETAFEVAQAVENTQQRPIARLNALGLLSPRLLAVHMTQLNEQEIKLCADKGVQVVHCPDSNMKLASGMCPVHKLQQVGVNVCIGTDSASSNNNLDMLGEARSAALLGKMVAEDATAVPAYTALRMATINGAKALGIDQLTGSLIPGKAADITAIDLSTLETQPLFCPVSQIVYSACRTQVTHVWVDGQCLLDNRKLTTMDESYLITLAQQWSEKLSM